MHFKKEETMNKKYVLIVLLLFCYTISFSQSMFEKLVAWLQETDARMPFLNPKFDKERHRIQQIQTRTKTLPALERDHAAVLKPDYVPRGGWWEDRGK